MTGSPTKNVPHMPPPPTSTVPAYQLGSPRSTPRLRKLQSAHALSSNYAAMNGPSLISQQRQQQQRNVSTSQTISSSQTPHAPSLPQIAPLSFAHSHNRARSNSDFLGSLNVVASPRRNLLGKKMASLVPPTDKHEIETIVRQGPQGDLVEKLDRIRHLVLVDGLESDNDGMSQLRIYIWLILLNAPPLSTDAYLDLIHRGPSPAYSKIRNDTFRTLATDPLFKRRVSEASLIRLLNAIAWKLHDAKMERMTDSGRTTNAATELGSPELQHASPVTKHAQGPPTITTEGSEAGGSEPGIYVQGMNVLCAPFLYAARSEAEAFIAFHRFITKECPGYVRGAMDGVHKGLGLVDKCLAIVDPKLSGYLHSKGMTAEIYAFASVLTMCACTPPLPEVLILWDFLFAYGPHLNILCICAQLLVMKDTLLASPSPTKILRSFPPLRAKKVIELAVGMVRRIPVDLYEELVHHAD